MKTETAVKAATAAIEAETPPDAKQLAAELAEAVATIATLQKEAEAKDGALAEANTTAEVLQKENVALARALETSRNVTDKATAKMREAENRANAVSYLEKFLELARLIEKGE